LTGNRCSILPILLRGAEFVSLISSRGIRCEPPAKVQLVELGILDRDKWWGVNQTLNAAALTYVAAFAARLDLLYLLSRRDN